MGSEMCIRDRLSPIALRLYAIFAAQPPNSFLILGTRKATFKEDFCSVVI